MRGEEEGTVSPAGSALSLVSGDLSLIGRVMMSTHPGSHTLKAEPSTEKPEGKKSSVVQ